MAFDSSTRDELFAGSRSSSGSKILAAACALAVAAILLGGYAYLRNRHAVRPTASVVPTAGEVKNSTPKGPAKVHVLVDDPLIKPGEVLIGGSVKNISSDNLTGLSVQLELWRRKDSGTEEKTIALDPAALSPGQEGRYSIKLPSQDYASIRLVGVKDGGATLIAHSSGRGIERPLEKPGSKTVIVQKPGSGKDDFLNTPDKPGRLP